MRTILLVVTLAATATGCRAARSGTADELAARRDGEHLDLARRRGEAVLDVSGQPPSNGSDVYFPHQAERQHPR